MNVKLKYEISAPYKDNLIRARGISDVEQFLLPSPSHLQEPHYLGTKSEMETAKNWIEEHQGCAALTVDDSDCDGFCASTILLNYLKDVYPNWEIDFFTHSKKQHGLEDVVHELDLDEYELVFLPDAGSNDDEYFAQYPNTKFIILDHHLRSIEGPCPDNAVIIHNQIATEYKNKSLSGAGVTWQFCRYLDYELDVEYADQYTDLAAVAIIGDVMDITTLENRYIIDQGIHNFKNTFLKLLRDNAAYSLGGSVTPIGIAFYIVPMINSMCRMGTADEKERLFLAFSNPTFQVPCHKRGVAAGTMIDVAIESVRECTNAKARQKKMQTQMAELCEKQIIENGLDENKIMIIQLDDEFEGMPSEMNGLTATKLANDYGHPVIIGRVNNDGYLRGSMRGLSTIDMPPLKEFFISSGLFEYVEGHSLAAGCSIPYSKLDAFTAWANEQLKDVQMDSKTWFVDFKMKAKDSDLKAVITSMDELSHLWGQGFPEAMLYVDDITVSRADIAVMGKNADTVKITCNGVSYMFFKRSPEEVKALTQYARAKLRVVGTANLNVYYNRTTPQIFVSDYEIEDDKLGF